MNLAVEAPQWLALLLTVLLLAAAAEDSVRLRISNVTVLLVMVTAVIAAVVVGPELALWQNVAVFAALLAVGTLMFAAGKLGGGDVKLLAAVGLWFDLKGALWMLLDVVLAEERREERIREPPERRERGGGPQIGVPAVRLELL